MSVINRMLRDLDLKDKGGELTLENPPARAAADAGGPSPSPAAPRNVAAPAAAARQARACATASTPSLDPDAGSSPPRSARARWRLPVLVLTGAAAIAGVALVDLPPALSSAFSSAASPAQPAQAVQALAPADPVPAAAPSLAVPAVIALATAPNPPAESPLPTAAAGARGAAPLRTARPAPTQAPPADGAAPTTASAGTPLVLAESALASGLALPSMAVPPSAATRIDKRNLPPTAEQRAKALMHNAMELARTGQRQAALLRAQEALAIDPHYAAARQLAAVLLYEAGTAAPALALLREGVELEAAPPALALLLARFLAHQNLGPEALAVLDRHGLNTGEAEGLRAGLLAQAGLYGRALVAFESAVRQQPGVAMWWLGMAVALESEGDGARARQAFARARQLGLPQADLASYVDQRLRALD